MKLARYLFFAAVLVLTVSWFTHSATGKKPKAVYLPLSEKKYTRPAASMEKLEQKATEAKKFILKKGYNPDICFLIDMSLASGQNRFFVYDLQKDTVQSAGLVTHGNCFEYWLEGRRYSNVVGSGCTSLGKYRIGNFYTGKFGYSYKLYGLDSTNNNAFERTVVLHSHSCVPDHETSEEICQSNGCTTVSPAFLEQLKPIINNSKKPVLLWVFE
jgi:hypothetical protein